MVTGPQNGAVIEQYTHEAGVKFLFMRVTWADVAKQLPGSLLVMSRLIIWEGYPPNPQPFTGDFTTDFSNAGNILFDTYFSGLVAEIKAKDFAQFGRIQSSPGANVTAIATVPAPSGGAVAGTLFVGKIYTQWVPGNAVVRG